MASKVRTDWSLFLLRLAVGGMAFLAGLMPLLHARLPTTQALAVHWGLHLAEMLCGVFMLREALTGEQAPQGTETVFMLLGLWMPLASFGLTLIIGWPLVSGWWHGAPVFGNLHGLFLLLVAAASALGGAGKWAVGRR